MACVVSGALLGGFVSPFFVAMARVRGPAATRLSFECAWVGAGLCALAWLAVVIHQKLEQSEARSQRRRLGERAAPAEPPAPSPAGSRLRSAGKQLVSLSADQRCPYCRAGLEGEVTSCGACRTVLHKECLIELGGCPVQGCRNNPRARRSAQA